MKDSFLQYYHDELFNFQQLSQIFSKNHPEAASHLGFHSSEVTDPFIAHLLESFCFQTARIRELLEGEDKILTDFILNQLYPHYFQAIPSLGIIQYLPQENFTDIQLIPSQTAIAAHLENHQKCQFRTIYDTLILPIRIENIAMENKNSLILKLKTSRKDIFFFKNSY